MDIYIANLNANIEEDALTKLFEVFGEVTSAVLVRDKETRQSKGYGFVKMPNAIEAQRAIDDMHGRTVAERSLVVKEAIPKDAKPAPRNNDFISVKFDRDKQKAKSFGNDYEPGNDSDLSLEVKDQVSFSKTVLEDGLIKVTFNN